MVALALWNIFLEQDMKVELIPWSVGCRMTPCWWAWKRESRPSPSECLGGQATLSMSILKGIFF